MSNLVKVGSLVDAKDGIGLISLSFIVKGELDMNLKKVVAESR